ncbi:MAG: hypothetical protein COT74_12065 [Bdellovibrionales bacterium CG10_big_fil_rev_8_21_14_0_10_45_34]|nr:MAG: hypothetical protein COT74_12065 [Bdellovibrionales bacterium CG10_big_fil_rev_8_21_14_0_10_45_34]
MKSKGESLNTRFKKKHSDSKNAPFKVVSSKKQHENSTCKSLLSVSGKNQLVDADAKPSKLRRVSRKKQLVLIKEPRPDTKLWWIETQHQYGGSLHYRKVKRPFDTTKLIHTVFKAKLGKNIWFTKSQVSIGRLLETAAKRYKLKLKDKAINKDHIHLLIEPNQSQPYDEARREFLRFLRFFAAQMARKYEEIHKRLGLKKSQDFWIARPFTRLVGWGRKTLTNIRNYFEKNRNEAAGFVTFTPRKHRLNAFLAKWQTQAQKLGNTS